MRKILVLSTFLFSILTFSCARNAYECYINVNAEGSSSMKGYNYVKYIKGSQQGFAKSELGGVNRRYSLPKSSNDTSISDGYDIYFKFDSAMLSPEIMINSYKSDNGTSLILVNRNTLRLEKILKDDTITVGYDYAYKVLFKLGDAPYQASTNKAVQIEKIEFLLNESETSDERRYGCGFAQYFSMGSDGYRATTFYQSREKPLTFRVTCAKGYAVDSMKINFQDSINSLTFSAVEGLENVYQATVEADSASKSTATRTIMITTKEYISQSET